MSQAEDAELLATDVAFWSLRLDEPETSLKEVGRLAQELAPKQRALAILALLVKGDAKLFAHHLSEAGKARLIHLRRLKDAGISNDFLQASGRYQPLLSAIAAADWSLAGGIVDLSPTQQLRGEYDDDHCLAQVVGRLLASPRAAAAAFPDLFAKWKEYSGDDADPRFDVLRAIVAGAQTDFDAAFERLSLKFAADIAAAEERGQHEDAVRRALREIDIDGLAFLRLAEKQGLAAAGEYPHIPAGARVSSP